MRVVKPKTLSLFTNIYILLGEDIYSTLLVQSYFCGRTIEIYFTGVLKQGERDGPKAWNFVMRWLMGMLHDCWVQDGLGISLET